MQTDDSMRNGGNVQTGSGARNGTARNGTARNGTARNGTGVRYDAVVVGAGPAGSIAALVLARGGARVALVDKAAFPRDKACGDLVGPHGVQVLTDLGLTVPDAGVASDMMAVGPSGNRSRLPAFPGRTYPGHGLIIPRLAFDHSLRESALAAGAAGVKARVTAVDRDDDGQVRAVITSGGQRLAADVIVGADGSLSPVARLAGLLNPGGALWGFAVRAYVPGDVPLPLLVSLDSRPWHLYPGYGWLFPGADGQANVGIGLGLGRTRRSTPLRDDLTRFCALLRHHHDLAASAEPGPVIGGWLQMGGYGTAAARGNVLLAGDAAGLINPLQGEGIAQAMVSGRLAAESILAAPGEAAARYTAALTGIFAPYAQGAATLQRAMISHPRAASLTLRAFTAPGARRLIASTWSLYWNGLADGAVPRPAALAARAIQSATARAARR